MCIVPIPNIKGLWRITCETNGYVLVENGKSIMIDCPSFDLSDAFTKAEIPTPEIILHTQIQEEHCREWAAFPDTNVYVYSECAEIARLKHNIHTTWNREENWMTIRGAEKYGHCGCITERPPQQPLNITHELNNNEIVCWQGQEFKLVKLPGSGKYACGIYWANESILFSGDLVHSGGYIVNFYDIERCYGLPTGYKELRHSLMNVLELCPNIMLPTTGPIIETPHKDCVTLLARTEWIENPPALRPNEAVGMTNYQPISQFRGYKQILPGLFQNNNYGNIILLITPNGSGLIIDPDACGELSWDESIREFETDLLHFENEHGLKRIDSALFTHYHGDHVRLCNVLQKRYNTELIATPDVAKLLETPHVFPYPCKIPWYDLPFDYIKVNHVIPYDIPQDISDISITPIHTPGHTYAHTGFVFTWCNTKIVCTGDTLQYGDGPIQTPLPIMYNDAAWPDRGYIKTYDCLAAIKPDLVLGGHSHSFYDKDGTIVSDFLKSAKESIILAKQMVLGDLQTAMTPPGYDEMRTKLCQIK